MNRKTLAKHCGCIPGLRTSIVISKNCDAHDFNIIYSFNNTCYWIMHSYVVNFNSDLPIRNASLTLSSHLCSLLKSSVKRPELFYLFESTLNIVQITEDIKSTRNSLKNVTYGSSMEMPPCLFTPGLV